MRYKDLIVKIKKWREVAQKQNDFFIKFALEYFAFNALLRIALFPNAQAVRDRDLINELKEQSKCEEYILNNYKEWIEELKKELAQKPLQNLTRNTEIKAKDLEKWESLVEAVYWIRNNLFHGYKHPGDERDQNLVRIGYHLLSGFNEWLIKGV